jgi:hypothetical protein
MRRLIEALSALVSAICAATEQKKEELAWIKSHAGLATKQDLKEMEKRLMANQVKNQTELIAELDRMRTQTEKVRVEQSKRFDDVLRTIAELNAIIAAGPLLAGVAEKQLALAESLQAFDDVVLDPVGSPTIDLIPDTTVAQDSADNTISLGGIAPGTPGGSVSIEAVSSDPAIVPNPTVTYTSPNSTGSLSLSPVPGASGGVTITVTVSDGSKTAERVFAVTVTPA